jgi:PAS domain S-box-containing protein
MTSARILIVEDEFIVARDIEARLADLGYAVVGHADSGQGAIDMTATAAPELVLMDIRLKGAMDGIAAAEEIRRRFGLPVVFLTAYAEDSTLERAKLAEPFGYILKPFEDQELRTILEIALYKHGAELEIQRLNRLYSALCQINQAIIHVQSRAGLFSEACRIAADCAGFEAVWVGWLERSTGRVRPLATAGRSAGFFDTVEFYADGRSGGHGPVGACIQSGQPCVVRDFPRDSQRTSWHDLADRFGLRAAAALPLRFQGEVGGVLAVFGSQPQMFRDREVDLLREAAEDISFALDHLEQQERLQRLARVVEQSPVSIVITDAAGAIEYVNARFCQITGYTAAEMLGRNPRVLKSGETPSEVYHDLWATLIAGNEWRGEFENQRKDGSRFHEMASIFPLRDAGGVITHYIGLKEDVTEIRLLESKFLRAQRLEGIGSLASGIAHDLNNILAPIALCASLLRSETGVEDRQHLLDTIEAGAERAVGVVRQLLNLGRGREGGKVTLQPRHLVREMQRIVQETFPRSIRVSADCPSDLWSVLGNATEIHQVLLNLCVNARDAMPEGGQLMLVARNVEIDPGFVALNPEATPGRYVRLEIADTGMGIADAIRAQIFDPFFTTKGPDKGTGLGLTTVLGIVKDHKGFLTLQSAPGRGASFQVHLPALAEGASATEPAEVRTRPPRGNGERVLVVDDEPAIRQATQRTLERHGYRVRVARDGAEAFAEVTTHAGEFDVVITDLLMPVLDGVGLCRGIRGIDPRIPILVCTGAGAGETTPEAVVAMGELQVDRLLHKPHDAATLLEALNEVLQARRRGVRPGTKAERPGNSGADTGVSSE